MIDSKLTHKENQWKPCWMQIAMEANAMMKLVETICLIYCAVCCADIWAMEARKKKGKPVSPIMVPGSTLWLMIRGGGKNGGSDG